MKNVKPYQEDSIEFFKNVLNSKNTTSADPDYKARVNSIKQNIEILYKSYEEHFKANTLELINQHGYVGKDKDDLNNLYSYSNSVLQNLKVSLTTDSNRRVNSTCQNCTISEINSFDHLLPQSEFSEFIINPINLFPSCTKCNGSKSVKWRQNGKRIFLNLYVDILPDTQYLYVNVDYSDNVIQSSFYLNNNSSIDALLFDKIKDHYSKLKLFRRFSENSNKVITKLTNIINAQMNNLSVEDIRELQEDVSRKNKAHFGQNYWETILEDALIKDDKFFDFIENI